MHRIRVATSCLLIAACTTHTTAQVSPTTATTTTTTTTAPQAAVPVPVTSSTPPVAQAAELVPQPAPAALTPPAPSAALALSTRLLVVAASDGLWRSVDAGRTWHRTLHAAVAVGALGRAGRGVGASVSTVSSAGIGRSNGDLYLSDDGARWRKVTPMVTGFGDNHSLTGLRVSLDGTSPSAHGLAFAVSANPAISSGPMLHSSDGGRHWSGVRGLSTDNSGVGAVGFVPGTTEVLAAVSTPQWAPCTSRFMRSEDSGASWSVAYRGCLADGVTALSFTDSTHGFAGSERLLVTIDGGRHWERQAAQPAPRAATATSYERLNYSSRSYGSVLAGACQASRDYENPCSGDVWTTADGGRSWQDGHLSALTVSSYGRTVITVGGPTTPAGLSISRDGGRSWRRVVTPTDVRLTHLSGPGAGLLAITNGDSVISSDTGRTWHKSRFPFLSGDPYGALAESGTVALRSSEGDGPPQRLERSVDAGRTWTAVHLPVDNIALPPGSIAFDGNDPSRAVAVSLGRGGNGSQVLTSTDSGRSWALVATLRGTLSGTVGYSGHTLALLDGQVEVSHDDGRHWVRHYVQDGYLLNAVGVGGGSIWATGYVAGADIEDRVLVLTSSDGGTAWSSWDVTGLHPDRWTSRFPAVLPLSGHQALLTMADSSLWRTTDAGATWRQERPLLPVA